MTNNTKIVLLVGAPSTGKTSVINHLKTLGYVCFTEISRQLILDARDKGIEYLFKTDPLFFSKQLLEKRIQQYNQAKALDVDFVFIDRGIPDIVSYLDMQGVSYTNDFIKACKLHIYDKVFWFPFWESIYTKDNERYESINLAKKIEEYLLKTYHSLGYQLIEVPKYSAEKRALHLLQYLKQ